MYKDFFRLEQYPFHNTPDPGFYYNSAHHREALATMLYGVQEAKGFILITGNVGTGKTMLVQALKNELAPQHLVIEIVNPWVSPEDVLNAIRVRLELPVNNSEEPALFDTIRQRLISLDEEGRRVILIIDEAHQLPTRTLEGIRLLSNIETATRKLLQIILLGQEELTTMLSEHNLRQIQQRIALTCHLKRFSESETTEYIRHRLRVAGGNTDIFLPEALAMIYAESFGIPRVINHLCDKCMLFAFGRRSRVVDGAVASDVIGSMRPRVAEPAVQATEPPVPLATVPANTFSHAAAAEMTSPSHAVDDSPPQPSVSADPMQLPFEMPSAMRRPASVTGSSPSQSVGMKWLVLTMTAGIVIGGGIAWLLLSGGQSMTAVSGSGVHQPASSAPAQPQAEVRPVSPPPSADRMGQSQVASIDGGAVPGQVAVQVQQANSSSVVAAPATGAQTGAAADPPFPIQGAKSSLRYKDVQITGAISVGMAATANYGAWNPTVQDIILAANPMLRNLESVPAETIVKMPLLSRESMVVQEAEKKFLVYFATLEDEESARTNLEALHRVWTGAKMMRGERFGKPLYRLYVGSFNSRSEAAIVAGSIWFKYLPVLNNG